MNVYFWHLLTVKKGFIVGGIYRHPNGNVKHFVSEFEFSLDKILDGISAMFVGDIDIDIIKYNNGESEQYMITVSYCRFYLI